MEKLKVFKNAEFGNVRMIQNPDGSISINAEDTAIGFGWTTVAKSGNEVVRWARMNNYCKELEFSQQVGKDTYLPESLFYMLAMKANNERAFRFQKWIAMDVLPAIRKTGMYQLEGISKELQAIIMQDQKIQVIEQKVENLENNMTIDYAQQQSVGKAVNKAVIKALGGKDSNAYHEIGKKVFSECNRDIKDYFCINARNNIPRVRFQDAMSYIEHWQPSTNTRIMIEDCNAQLRM